MKLQNIGNVVMRKANKVGFWAKRNSPELLMIAGVASAAGAIIFAIKSTLKLEDTIKLSNEEIAKIKADMDNPNKLANGEYSISYGRRDLAKAYTKVGFKIIKLYSPSIVLFAVSASSMLSSHKILKGRNFALAAAYTTLENSFTGYRERVKAKLGDKAEKELYRNIYKEEVEVVEYDENGNEKIVKKKVDVPHMDNDSGYSYLFDETNHQYSAHKDVAFHFIATQELYMNQKLKAQGYLFLSDVYEALDIEPSQLGPNKVQAAKVVGWIYDLNDNSRDNYVSFGISDENGVMTDDAMEFKRGNVPGLWLEFNPDGDILTGKNNNKTFMQFAKTF